MHRALVDIDEHELAAALTSLWGRAKPATWNRNRATVSSWLAWCARTSRGARPRSPRRASAAPKPADHTRAVDAGLINRICTRRTIPPRERLLWRMLY